MTSIALMSVPLHGHVHPMLGLAAELVRRGHEVTFASGEDFADVIAATGARAVTYPSTLRSTRTGAGDWIASEEVGARAVDLFAEERAAAFEPLLRAYETIGRPDVVVFDQVTAVAEVLASRWAVPTVQFSPTHALPKSQPTHGGRLSSGAPCIVALPESFQAPFPDLPDGIAFVGPISWRREEPGSWSSDDAPLVLVSLGTTFNQRTDVVRAVAAAVSDLRPEHQIIVALGRPLRSDDADGWPTRTRVEPWVPQQEVLGLADLFVTAGGTGSVLEAACARTRIVVLPQAPEQMLNARQVVALGLGTAYAGPDPSREEIRDVIEAAFALDDYSEAASRFALDVDRAGGAAHAADIVEAALTPDARNAQHRQDQKG
ncbi:MAG TPA: hypothetical protein H9800_10965 [Candidatus Microbacterium stercoravium]|uniref:Glycosyltransferase n=1 Tax=Candidatus Microbacterium stercoravium TaxID=2838697 RepID=A0A9D2H7Z6_9MICO|nr:hypothetical protein [Candidatus Microbacterium stercoravium]